MNHLGRSLQAMLSVYYADMLEYRAELLFWVLSGSLPLILMGVWAEAANTTEMGLSAIEFIRYFLAVFLVRQFTVVWVIWEFEREVVEGKLSFHLLHPIDPGWRHFITHVVERLARMPFVLGLILLFVVLYPQAAWQPSLLSLIQWAVATLLAFLLRFLMQYTFAIFAFWMERASAIEQVWFLFYLFLSGMIAPLEVFPPLIRAIVLWTPFPYLIHFPASLLVGFSVNFTQGIGVMLAWSLVFGIINRWLWKQGLKRFSGMGA